MIKAKKFIDHESLVQLTTPLTPYLKTALAASALGEKIPLGTDLQQYAGAIFGRVDELENCFIAMDIAVHEISKLSKSLPPGSAALYRYHYENYLLRLSGVFDRACRLVGEAIKVAPKKLDSIATNSFVLSETKDKYPEVHQILTKLQKLLDEKRVVRNLVAHAEAYSNRELGLYIAIEQIGPDRIDRSDVEPLMRTHFTNEASSLNELGSNCEALIQQLLNFLAPILQQHAAVALGDRSSES